MITVIDSVMGSGKTSWAIQYINSMPDNENVMYITPFLDEVTRIIEACPDKHIYEPLQQGCTKKMALYDLLYRELNIASTHELFKRLDSEALVCIDSSQHKYTLILDEVLDAIEQVNTIKKADIDLLIKSEKITVKENGLVVWNNTSDKDSTRYDDIKMLAEQETLFCVNDTAFIWKYPPYLFEMFDDIYIMTYLFDSSILSYYFRSNGFNYEKKSVARVGEEYRIVDYYVPDTSIYRDKIHIYHGKYNTNYLGNKDTTGALSKTWFSKNKDKIKQLQKNVKNYFKNEMKAPAKKRLWTCFKNYIDDLNSVDVRKNTYLACNCRATNNHAHTKYLAYLVNRYPHMTISQYFNSIGIKINDTEYALSEMIQWIWRSAIRNGEEIYIYIPSYRMRTILMKWLGYSANEIMELES